MSRQDALALAVDENLAVVHAILDVADAIREGNAPTVADATREELLDDPDENEARLEDQLAAWRRRQEIVEEATAQAHMWRDEALAGGLTNGVEDLLDRLIAEVEAVDRA